MKLKVLYVDNKCSSHSQSRRYYFPVVSVLDTDSEILDTLLYKHVPAYEHLIVYYLVCDLTSQVLELDDNLPQNEAHGKHLERKSPLSVSVYPVLPARRECLWGIFILFIRNDPRGSNTARAGSR